jgi:hypothetical protein
VNTPDAARLSLIDSEIAEVRQGGARLQLRFSAARVVSGTAQPGSEAWWRPGVSLQLTLSESVSESALQTLRGRLHEATLRLNDQTLSLLPLPWSVQGDIRLALQAGWGDTVQLRASQASVVWDAEARASPDLAC